MESYLPFFTFVSLFRCRCRYSHRRSRRRWVFIPSIFFSSLTNISCNMFTSLMIIKYWMFLFHVRFIVLFCHSVFFSNFDWIQWDILIFFLFLSLDTYFNFTSSMNLTFYSYGWLYIFFYFDQWFNGSRFARFVFVMRNGFKLNLHN